MENYKQNFGKQGRDKVTGFTGVIGGVCEYTYGCTQYLLTPPVDKDGKLQDGQWFDTARIEITEAEKIEGLRDENPGCDSCSPNGNH